MVQTSSAQASVSLDSATQKMELRLSPTAEELADKPLTVGSFVTLKIPLQAQADQNIVPISAVSFEPDGAEVLLISETDEAQRQKVVTGKIIGDSVAIESGFSSW